MDYYFHLLNKVYKPVFICLLLLKMLLLLDVAKAKEQDLLGWSKLISQTEGWQVMYPKALFKFGGFTPDAALKAKVKGHIYWNSKIPSFRTAPKGGAVFNAGQLRSNISYLALDNIKNKNHKTYSKFIRKDAVISSFKNKDEYIIVLGQTRNGNLFNDKVIFSKSDLYVLKVEFPEHLSPIMNVIIPRMQNSFKRQETTFMQCERKCVHSKSGCKVGKLYPWCAEHNEKCRISCYKKFEKQ